MFERYTERARRVLFFARYEASQLGSVSIETEHLLLGLIREGKGLTSRIFARAHLSLADLRTEIEARSAHHDRASMSVEIPFSDETKRVLLAAHLEALEHDYIGTEHLLLGLLYEEQSVAGSLLIEKGCRLDDVRSEMVRLLSEKSAGQPEQSVRIVVPPAPKKRRAGPIRLVIVVAQADDAASRQLLAGARDACADARIAYGAITVVPVPGVSQIPVTVQCAAETGMFDAAVCLGILVRATARQADSTVSAVAHGLQLVASRTTMPWSFGVLATDSVEEATGCATREGYEAAKAALEMVAVVRTLRDADSSGL